MPIRLVTFQVNPVPVESCRPQYLPYSVSMERKWALRGQLKYSLSIQCQGGLQVPNSLVLAIGGTGGNRTLVQFTVMTLRVQIYETPHIAARGRAPDAIGSGVT